MPKKRNYSKQRLSKPWQLMLLLPLIGISPSGKLPGTEGDKQSDKLKRLRDEIDKRLDLEADEREFLKSFDDLDDLSKIEPETLRKKATKGESWIERLISKLRRTF